MRIDAHQHFWKYQATDYSWINEQMTRLQRDFLPNDLNPLLEKAHFDGCIAVQARQSLEETAFLLDLCLSNPSVLGVVGWVDLQAPDLESHLSEWQQHPGLLGFRHIVQDEADPQFLLRPDFIRGVKSLPHYGYTYDILVYEQQLPLVPDFLARCPDQPFVLDHLGKPVIQQGVSSRWKEAIRAAAKFPNLYCKVSGLVTEANWHQWSAHEFQPFVDEVLEAFGPQRLMVGSDWPVCLLAAEEYADVIQLAEYLLRQLSVTEQQQVFGQNAAKFYGISDNEEDKKPTIQPEIVS